jgi:hypothetical protein
MGRKGFWTSDCLLGVLVALAVAWVSQATLVKRRQRKACDLGLRASSSKASERIAVIAIDDSSVANIGHRSYVHAQLIQKLAPMTTPLIARMADCISPEQLAGKKIAGPFDLFSLGTASMSRVEAAS